MKGALVGLALLLAGCASLPGTLPALPQAQNFTTMPNCVAWCHIVITVEKADSKLLSTGQGAVTAGSQTLSSSSTLQTSSTDSNSVQTTKDSVNKP